MDERFPTHFIPIDEEFWSNSLENIEQWIRHTTGYSCHLPRPVDLIFCERSNFAEWQSESLDGIRVNSLHVQNRDLRFQPNVFPWLKTILFY